MKKSMKLLTILLALIMMLSILPATALATGGEVITQGNTNVALNALCFTNTTMKALVGTYDVAVIMAPSVTVDADTFGTFITFNGRLYEYRGVYFEGKLRSTITLDTGLNYALDICYTPHTHTYKMVHNRVYHWEVCACGKVVNKEKHVDPATDEDSICICDYEFSHNADLVTLWMKDMVISPRFNKATTEYTAEVYTYKNVTSTKVSKKTSDALATVTLPDDLSIEDGVNRFEITVTAQDGKTTKTYTVTAYKAVKVGNMTVTSTEGATSIVPAVTLDKHIAAAQITEEAINEAISQASSNASKKVILAPNARGWRTTRIEITAPAAALEAISQEAGGTLDLVITTKFGDVTIPNATLEALTKDGETVTIVVESIDDQASVCVFVDDKDVTDQFDTITLDLD